MKPYYDDGQIQIFHGDCRDVLPTLERDSIDLVLTDPPYPDYHTDAYQYRYGGIDFLNEIDCRQFVFWSAKVDFPLDYTACHIWDKVVGVASQYERIFERNGHRNYGLYRYSVINSRVTAGFVHDYFTGHPSQKPLKLIRELMAVGSKERELVLDPFMGSGTTLRAAKDLGRKAIGIEIEERYCEIAVKRLQQSVLALEVA